MFYPTEYQMMEISAIVDRNIKSIPRNSSKAYSSLELPYNMDKVNKAKNSYGYEATGTIIGLVDAGLLFSGKKGVLFTTEGIAFKEETDNRFVRYDAISRTTFDKENDKLMIYPIDVNINNHPFISLFATIATSVLCVYSIDGDNLYLSNLRDTINEIVQYISMQT